MNSDNALLIPMIHLGYLPDAHVVALLRRAKESIWFFGPDGAGDHGQQYTEGEAIPMKQAMAACYSEPQIILQLTENLQGA